MNHKRLTFFHNGREALPVRAIPYVADWKNLLSPDVVANSFADAKDPHSKCVNLTSYFFQFEEPVEVSRREWQECVLQIQGFSAKLKRKYANWDESRAAWRKGAASKLPAGVFVWLDEFEKEYQAECRRKNRGSKQLIDEKLNLEWSDAKIRAMVMEGFYQSLHAMIQPHINKSLDELPEELRRIFEEECRVHWNQLSPERRLGFAKSYDDDNDPSLAGKRYVDSYDYELSASVWWQLKNIKPLEAAMLLCKFNPDDDECDPTTITNNETAPKDYKLLLRVFEDEEKADARTCNLMQWRDIARDKNLKYHSWIDKHEEAMKLLESVTHADKGEAGADTPPGDNWREKAPVADDPDYDETLAALFDPVPVEVLATMFMIELAQWKKWQDKAKAKGLINAREGRGKFNPYKAGVWLVHKGTNGWDVARLYRTLANNLPARSLDNKHLLTGGID